MPKTTKVVSLAMPPRTLREVDRLARGEQRSRSQFVTRALDRVIADSNGGSSMSGDVHQSRAIADKLRAADVARAAAMVEHGRASNAVITPLKSAPGSQSK
jgi:hypothetical protein